jgi:hypothetical protein
MVSSKALHMQSSKRFFPLIPGRVIDQKKIRGGVIFVNEFPLTATGKVIKSALKERIQKMDFQ